MNEPKIPENQAVMRQILLNVWRDILQRPDLGVDEDFFGAGGSSMEVIEMLWKVSGMFDKEIDHTEFFKQPSIKRLSELLQS